jgi:hypothetical protein
MTFDLTVDGAETRRVTIDKNTIDSTLGTSNGMINTADDLAAVIRAAMSNMSWSRQRRCLRGGTHLHQRRNSGRQPIEHGRFEREFDGCRRL